MGASQSYQKRIKIDELSLANDIDDLTGFLNYRFPTNASVESSETDEDFFNTIRNDKIASINELCKTDKDSSECGTNIFNNLEKIKRSIDLIMLYDNYNINNGVIIKDLSKKYNNQIAEIKKRTEYTDLINYDLNVIKNKINKNNKIDRTLLIFIIIFVILIIALGFLTALKFVKV